MALSVATTRHCDGSNRLGKLRIGNVAHQPPVESYVDTHRREQQCGMIAFVYGWNRREKPLHVVRIKVGRRLAILLEALLPCLSSILRIHVAQKPDVEQFPFLRVQDRVWVAVLPIQVQTGHKMRMPITEKARSPMPLSRICVPSTTRVSGVNTPSKSAACATDKAIQVAAAKINPRTLAIRS